MDVRKLPLHGTKTHPLTDHAVGVLGRLCMGPVPRHEINPGVFDRLCREDLAEQDGKMIVVTEAGRQRYENEASARNERAAGRV